MEENKDKIIIYKDVDGPELSVKLQGETIWLTQEQIANLFQTNRSSITKHLRNIINSAELREKSNVQFLHIANSDKPVKFYNLDFIIAVGYRVNSKRATQFRIWATQKLRDYLLKGFVLNEQRLKEQGQSKLKELEGAVKLLQHAIETKRLAGYEKELLTIITDYTSTWILLNQYDEGKIELDKTTKGAVYKLDYNKVNQSIQSFRARLVKDKQAGSLFGREVGSKLAALLGNIEQTFDGKPLYHSLEEKAAHLLYLAIKDHPFADGNKRIGSLLFLLYLVENHRVYNRHGERLISDNTLTALALLIAESKPDHKEVMVKLVANLIANK